MTDTIGGVTLPILTLHDYSGKTVTLDGVCSTRAEVDAIRKLFRHISAARVIGLVGGKEVFEDITSCLENIQECSFDADDVLDGWYLLRGLNFGSESGRPGTYPFSILLWFIETESITLETIGKTYGETSVLYTDLNPLLFKAGVTLYLKAKLFVYDDDETFWSKYEADAGSYTVTLSEETTIKIQGTSSQKFVVSAGAFATLGVNHTWGTGKDWSDFEDLCLYVYGANTSLTLRVFLYTDGSNYQYWNIMDDFMGWQRFTLDMATPDSETGTFDPSDVTEIRIVYISVDQTFTSYLDLVELEFENELPRANFVIDYMIGKATITLDYLEDGVYWCWSYNGNTTVYTGETVDINDSGASDVVLPPIQVTSVGDAIYFGAMSILDGVNLTMGTVGDYSDITLEWQYWDGDSWEALDDVVDATAFFTVGGSNNRISWTKPTDIEKTVVNGEEAYWIRCMVTAFGGSPSITTAPLGTQAWLFLEKEIKMYYEHIIE
jgi:hypothetical protein